MNNDLYISDLKKHTRVTFDGSKTVFNGVPDWVYEGWLDFYSSKVYSLLSICLV